MTKQTGRRVKATAAQEGVLAMIFVDDPARIRELASGPAREFKSMYGAAPAVLDITEGLPLDAALEDLEAAEARGISSMIVLNIQNLGDDAGIFKKALYFSTLRLEYMAMSYGYLEGSDYYKINSELGVYSTHNFKIEGRTMTMLSSKINGDMVGSSVEI